MNQLHMVFAYLSPETVMPLTSILATIAAVFLMYGKSMVRLIVYWVRRVTFRRGHGQSPTGPHFGLGRRRRRESSGARTQGQGRQVNE